VTLDDRYGSRGAVQAIKLANLISANGVPDPTTASQQRLQQFIGNAPDGNWVFTYYTQTT